MMSRATIAAGIWAECKVDEYCSYTLKEWKILQPEMNPNPFAVCFSSFLGLGNIQHLNNRAWYKGLQHHGWNFLGRQHHSYSQIETARWPRRTEVLLVLELGVHPGGVPPAEGATHMLTSSPSFALGPTKRKVMCSNYMQVYVQTCLQIPSADDWGTKVRSMLLWVSAGRMWRP